MTWKRTCIWKRDSMEFRNATSARLVMLMQTSHNDALKWKWKWNWNCKRHVTHLRPTKGSCANFLDPLSRRCAKLNRCQPTSLSFTLHQNSIEISNGINLSENQDITLTWYLLKFVICRIWKTSVTSQLEPAPVAWYAHSTQQQNALKTERGLTVLPLSPSLALH